MWKTLLASCLLLLVLGLGALAWLRGSDPMESGPLDPRLAALLAVASPALAKEKTVKLKFRTADEKERLSVPFERRWLLADKGAAVGFGAAAFAMCLVPGLNFFAMPLLVISGTLLVLRRFPDGVRAPDAGGGRATSP